ncbi:GpE family phage tail protein [Brevundimonas vitis]|uniref:GpE family phage tail protein n=1 Tax=Brevundimonas vitisensis TaxID=2800818 RepID=A0ABX7BK18_9CAUL|nr:GpE family phage tail protein [Brevundimonas vitisensis]QQQ17740.1 GpE family phage tail protein [Brevundimonas vitisensis]
MQECVAFIYHWPPHVLDELPLDLLQGWAEAAKVRLDHLIRLRTPVL